MTCSPSYLHKAMNATPAVPASVQTYILGADTAGRSPDNCPQARRATTSGIGIFIKKGGMGEWH
jgi:hypothetical protein